MKPSERSIIPSVVRSSSSISGGTAGLPMATRSRTASAHVFISRVSGTRRLAISSAIRRGSAGAAFAAACFGGPSAGTGKDGDREAAEISPATARTPTTASLSLCQPIIVRTPWPSAATAAGNAPARDVAARGSWRG